MGRLLAIITWTKDLCSLFCTQSSSLQPRPDPAVQEAARSGQTLHGSTGSRCGDGVMWISWCLWALVAICAGDQFRDEAERIMQETPVIDG